LGLFWFGPDQLIFLECFVEPILVGAVPYFDKLRGLRYFSEVMSGILSSFVGLLLSVTIRFTSNVPLDLPRIILGVAAFVTLILRVDILWIVQILSNRCLFALNTGRTAVDYLDLDVHSGRIIDAVRINGKTAWKDVPTPIF